MEEGDEDIQQPTEEQLFVGRPSGARCEAHAALRVVGFRASGLRVSGVSSNNQSGSV